METITKSTGALHFYDNEHVLKFELNLKNYYSNAKTIRNFTILLEKKCEENPNLANCKFFHGKLSEIADYAIKETRYLQLSRSKREIFCAAIALCSMLAITITTAITAFFVGAATAGNAQKEWIEQHNIQHNTTLKQFDHDENSIYIFNKTTYAIFDDANAMRSNFTEAQFITQIVESTLLIIDRHNRETDRFLNALGNGLKEKFFSIIDVTTFRDSLRESKIDSTILSLHPKDIMRLSILESEIVNDTILISVHIPIITNEKFDLIYLIPIPIKRDGFNFILNIDAKHIIKNDTKISEISLATLAQCMQAANLIVCNSLLWDQIMPINNCIDSIIKNSMSKAVCTYKKLANKTQMMKISDESIYVHIMDPILIKISCGQQSKIINITESMEIFHKKNCKLFNPKSRQNQDTHTTVIKINAEYTTPKFEIFENKTWSNNVLFLNQYNNEMKNLFREFRQNEMEFKQRSKLMNVSESTSFSLFPNLFENMTAFVLMFILIIVCIVTLISNCICRCSK